MLAPPLHASISRRALKRLISSSKTMPGTLKFVAILATLALLLVVAVAVTAPEEAVCLADGDGIGCALPQDCSVLEQECIQSLNSSSSEDFVKIDDVMAHLKVVGQERLHEGALVRDKWEDAFGTAYCRTFTDIPFPIGNKGVEKLRQDLAGREAILVHSDITDDGLGARFKKALQFAVGGLALGFRGVALGLPPAGSLLHPSLQGGWSKGPIWCHESPADGPDPPPPNNVDFPLVCWKMDLQNDLLGQPNNPEEAGSADRYVIGSLASKAPLDCVRFKSVPASGIWELVRSEIVADTLRSSIDTAMAGLRSISRIQYQLPGRRETQCGFGDSEKFVPLAMHLRRGDVSETANYALPERLGIQGFRTWLCSLAKAANLSAQGKKLMLHVYTESPGRTRASLRRGAKRGAYPGFVFEEEKDDEVKPLFHTLGSLDKAPSKATNGMCPEVLVEQVHFIVNNNPRDAMLCMARAHVLVTSFSSLSWVSAALSEGLVFHPDLAGESRSQSRAHWDLRYDYMDWAPNWFHSGDLTNLKSEPLKARLESLR
mmetsp:Transcript_3741/g.8449  ORF Transcript_3741/g.8449 Transcript_3741/m.8449 type:complete len:545 (+) Transcript_3741:1-1635(+)